jgi:hypothetical protein
MIHWHKDCRHFGSEINWNISPKQAFITDKVDGQVIKPFEGLIGLNFSICEVSEGLKIIRKVSIENLIKNIS